MNKEYLKSLLCMLVILFVIIGTAAYAQNVDNYKEQGGALWVVNGTIDVNGTADFTGATVTSLGTVATADINGGTIDGATVGAASPSTGSFTTLTGTGVITLGDVSDTELHYLNGAAVANTGTTIAPLLDAAGALQTGENLGTPGTGVTAVEYGDGYNHVTVLTVTAAALTPTTIPADAEGAGVIIYTFPAGVHLYTACHMDVTAFTGTGFAATNAVDIGIGSVISSGDIATLTSATMEDCVTGQTIADISSPAKEKSTIATAGAPLLFEASGSKVIHLNVAGTWNDTFTDPIITGTVTLYWTFLGT